MNENDDAKKVRKILIYSGNQNWNDTVLTGESTHTGIDKFNTRCQF